jgi:hypothetical protein
MRMAVERFLCWERSDWQCTAIPVGTWVMRMADSVLFTCCPPAPPERMVSMRRSFSSMSTVTVSSMSG